jgi:hypothetical protein
MEIVVKALERIMSWPLKKRANKLYYVFGIVGRRMFSISNTFFYLLNYSGLGVA